MNFPEKIFKYRAFNNLKYVNEIFEKKRLYLAKRKELNDPFEGCNFSVNLGVAGQGITKALKVHHPIIEERLDRYRFLSLSENCRSPQMWAHYADNYRGFCLQFSTLYTFKQIKPVSYIPSDITHEEQKIPGDENKLLEIITDSYFKKCKEWNYEKEYRILKPASEEYLEFDIEELETVILGINISEENKRNEEILINHAQKNGIRVLKMFISNENYKIRFFDYDTKIQYTGRNIEEYECKDI